jgi:hypothetical protein
MGLVQRSAQCRLICQLYKGDSSGAMQELRPATPPGAMVIFNGNKLWHAIAPLEAGAERIVLTMEYVTNPEMSPFHRFVSNMKDAIAYFGFSTLLRGGGCHVDVGVPQSVPPGRRPNHNIASRSRTFSWALKLETPLSWLSTLPRSGIHSAATTGNRLLHVV